MSELHPDFLLVGAQKAGTTRLAALLDGHSGIFISSTKELGYYTRYYKKGSSWYSENFVYAEPDQIKGEATPEYLSDPLVAERVYRDNCNIKIIILLRDPVFRAYSAFWHHVRRGTISTNVKFVDAMSEDLMGIRNMGDYSSHISRYLRYFPEENIKVILFEKFIRDESEVFLETCDFLGVSREKIKDPGSLSKNQGGQNLGIFNVQANWIRNSVPKFVLIWLKKRPVGKRVIGLLRAMFEFFAFGFGKKSNTPEKISKDLYNDLFAQYYKTQPSGVEKLTNIKVSDYWVY